ncbi:MAG TPA: Hpt domain-containing protein [Candidatus Acidoferrum sp.]|nr:Hpt domain-containing protein [Candidatus Acidoferrum sp.]
MTADPTEDAEYFAGLWDQFKDIVLERVVALEEAAAAVRQGVLGDGMRQRAEMAAHRLAGSLGSIGFPDGSRIALEIEGLLRECASPVGDQVSRLSALTSALRQTLDRRPG